MSERKDYTGPCPERATPPQGVGPPPRVPPPAQWQERPGLAFGVRVRVNLAIPAVWPM
ncbi:MAG: hypothetical protein SV910_07855 [Chloroflexota bacterium]|nr:hypothetical protein [Chloroflexota bacterium]